MRTQFRRRPVFAAAHPAAFRLVCAAMLAACFAAAGTGDCFAQYFGRNKVKYESFDFKILRTGNFDLYYYPETETATGDAGRMLERWYARFHFLFGTGLSDRQPVILYANHADFQQTNVIGGLISQGVGGVTEGMKNRVVIPFTGVYREDDHVLGHELVHAFQFDMARQAGGLRRSAGRVPLWFVEGMSEYLTLGHGYPLTSMWMRDAVLRDAVPTIDDVSGDPRYFPYRYGHAIWSYITSRHGDEVVSGLLLAAFRRGFNGAVEEVLGTSVDSLSSGWRESVEKTWGPELEGRSNPGDIGAEVISDGGGMNLSPAVSPDGRHLAYFSRKDIFTLDLYLADARTGEVIRKLVSSASDAHFDALRFIGSSGAWSPDGTRICFVVFEDGDYALAVLDLDSGDIIEKFTVGGVDAIHNIDWSPDGDRLAVSASSGSVSDLHVFHMESGRTEKLTSDRYAELQPAWSPDGRTIAFVTDRGPRTDLGRLVFGPMVIGLMNLDTGRIELVSLPGATKHIDPDFSPDGGWIYFVADPGGVSDIFRRSLESGRTERLTRIATGVSGLTDLSPALSVASVSGDLYFNVFYDMEYRIRSIGADRVESVATPLESGRYPGGTAGFEPSGESRTVEKYLESPPDTLPPAGSFDVTDYETDLDLVYAGMTSVGVATDRYGSSISGGTAFLFSDMLGNHNLGVTAYASGTIKDLGGELVYTNLRNRFNWGVLGGHLSYRTIGTFTELDTVSVGGAQRLAVVYNLVNLRTFVDQGFLLTEYPLSRNRRLELRAGYTHYSYDTEIDRTVTVDGFVVDRYTEDAPSPSSLDLARSSIAYVGDYSFYGFTSPARGRRYRVEVEPSFGSLRFLTATADYRHYLFFNPVTLAARFLHVGRYLKDADNDRLSSLFLGNETLVRGYGIGTFDLSDCSTTGSVLECPGIDRLSGSRIGVVNLELRLPLFGTERYGLIDFTWLPTELSLFLDGGVAWTSTEEPDLELSTDSEGRIPVFSTGAAVRFNLANYLVTQFYMAYPFQRSSRDLQWGFVIAPGW